MEPSTTKPSDAAETTADTLASVADRVWEELDVTERRVREVVRGHPITCFLGAVVGGYLIGRIARRI
jgi:hypothetical protein